MNIQTLQKGILDWFWLTPDEAKSLTAVENVCNKLYSQFLPNKPSKNAKYEIFFPLVRYGVIEFYSNNSYRLSPSCFLYSNKYILSCNCSNQKIGETAFDSAFIRGLGLDLYQNRSDYLSAFSKGNISLSAYSLINMLKGARSFRTILDNWTDCSVIETKGFLYFTNHYSWIFPKKQLLSGIYKKSKEVYSQRVVMINELAWKNIPNRAENIDAFNIACIWAHIENNWSLGILYDSKQFKLSIKNIFFPIILERQLFLNTLLEGAFNFNYYNRQYYIREREFLILNKLFSDKIPVI
jgi:hypothetical protein